MYAYYSIIVIFANRLQSLIMLFITHQILIQTHGNRHHFWGVRLGVHSNTLLIIIVRINSILIGFIAMKLCGMELYESLIHLKFVCRIYVCITFSPPVCHRCHAYGCNKPYICVFILRMRTCFRDSHNCNVNRYSLSLSHFLPLFLSSLKMVYHCAKICSGVSGAILVRGKYKYKQKSLK